MPVSREELAAGLQVVLDVTASRFDQLERRLIQLEIERQALKKERDKASKERLSIIEAEAAERQAGGYFADWVMDSGPEFFTRDTTEDVIIRTTLDQQIQRAAEEALDWVFETKVREGSEAQAAIAGGRR